MTKKAKPKTHQQIADEEGVTRQAISARKKKDAEQGPESASLREQIQAEQLRKLELENAKLEKFLAVLDGEYIPKKSVEENNRMIAFAVGQLIQDVRTQAGPMLEGLSAAEIDEKVETWLDNWETKLKDERDKVWQRAADAVHAELRGDMKKAAASKKSAPRKTRKKQT